MVFIFWYIRDSSKSINNDAMRASEVTICLYEEMEMNLAEINVNDSPYLHKSRLSSGMTLLNERPVFT